MLVRRNKAISVSFCTDAVRSWELIWIDTYDRRSKTFCLSNCIIGGCHLHPHSCLLEGLGFDKNVEVRSKSSFKHKDKIFSFDSTLCWLDSEKSNRPCLRFSVIVALTWVWNILLTDVLDNMLEIPWKWYGTHTLFIRKPNCEAVSVKLGKKHETDRAASADHYLIPIPLKIFSGEWASKLSRKSESRPL